MKPNRDVVCVIGLCLLSVLQIQCTLGRGLSTPEERANAINIARSLERDPQMESILANRKQQLGIMFNSGRRLGAELAFNHGIDLGRGRGLGIGM